MIFMLLICVIMKIAEEFRFDKKNDSIMKDHQKIKLPCCFIVDQKSKRRLKKYLKKKRKTLYFIFPLIF